MKKLNSDFFNFISSEYKKAITLNVISQNPTYNYQTGEEEKTIISSVDKLCYLTNVDTLKEEYQSLNLTTNALKIILDEEINEINEIIIDNEKYKIVKELQRAGYTIWLVDK